MSKEVKRYDPLLGLARNAKLRRMEMQCDPQWVLDLFAERDVLKAENKRLDLAVAQADHNYDMDRNRMMYLLRTAHDCLEQWNLKYPRLARRGEEFSSEHTYRQIRAFVPEYREADAALQGEQP
ncbi:hypothetical protein [Stutzerimonas nitrititolerans]|uniref:Uncharacterized protein n=1 Tax=Stutzerimonas nitrititolerans TaxID=2482751 RepID=A0AA41WN72_9GAMM|nr:hypothetical protein [Stutzerimonas nitrititolerans]MCO7546139.1 hypothetical protein [Stutzerimonas nitrititolerans]